MRTSENFPTTTVHQARLRLFQPTRRPVILPENKVIPTAAGAILIREGRLGQQHADVFEAILRYAERQVELEDGRYKLLVDPAVIRRVARQSSTSTYNKVLKELMATVIEIIEPKRLACLGHLIDHMENAEKKDGTAITRHDPLTKKKRNLKRIEIGKAASSLIQTDLLLHYDPAPIAALRHGISQAVVRWVLGHSKEPNGGWHLDTVIEAVCGRGISSQQLRDRRRELCADAEALACIGVSVNGGRVWSVEHKPGGRTQSRRNVEHKPEGVEHKPEKICKRGA